MDVRKWYWFFIDIVIKVSSLNFFLAIRKAQRYEQWPQQRPPTRSNDSPAPTTTPGRSPTSRGNITSTSSRPSSPTSLASYPVGSAPLLHSVTETSLPGRWNDTLPFLSFPSCISRFSSKRVLHQIQAANFRIVTHLVSRPSFARCVSTWQRWISVLFKVTWFQWLELKHF